MASRSQATECHASVHYHHRGTLSIVHRRQPSRPARLIQLYVGLALYGASSALLVAAGLGLEPWGVLHQGLAELTGLSIGVVSIIVGAAVLLLWIPLRQRPGLGTVSNVFVVGIAMDAHARRWSPRRTASPYGSRCWLAGIVLNGVATGLYIAARFGPGPRDGLMTGLHRRTGRSIRLVRTAIEVAVVATGLRPRRHGRRRHRRCTRWPSARSPSSSCACSPSPRHPAAARSLPPGNRERAILRP